MAFRAAADAVADLRRANVGVVTIPGADHFYTNARPPLIAEFERWLSSIVL
jgi:alpha/beta superfamily hydrolase